MASTSPPLGRAPIIDWPPWNTDGSIKITWQKWFNAIQSNIENLSSGEPLLPIGLAPNRSGINAQDVIITALVAAQMSHSIPSMARLEDLTKLPSLSPYTQQQTQISPFYMPLLSRPLATPSIPITQPILICTQATFPSTAILAPNTFIYVSDYYHWIFYDGVGFNFCGDPSNVYVVADTSPGNGWHSVDGSTVNYLNAIGTLTSKTLPSTIGIKAYLAVGSAGDGAIHTPVAPTISGHTETGTANITDTSVTINNPALGGTPEAVAEHNTEVDSGHTHNLTSANAPISTTGEPENFYSLLWFRL